MDHIDTALKIKLIRKFFCSLSGEWFLLSDSLYAAGILRDSLARLTMQAMMMTVPPTSDTTDSILATRPRRTAPSRLPCSRLFLD